MAWQTVGAPISTSVATCELQLAAEPFNEDDWDNESYTFFRVKVTFTPPQTPGITLDDWFQFSFWHGAELTEWIGWLQEGIPTGDGATTTHIFSNDGSATALRLICGPDRNNRSIVTGETTVPLPALPPFPEQEYQNDDNFIGGCLLTNTKAAVVAGTADANTVLMRLIDVNEGWLGDGLDIAALNYYEFSNAWPIDVHPVTPDRVLLVAWSTNWPGEPPLDVYPGLVCVYLDVSGDDPVELWSASNALAPFTRTAGGTSASIGETAATVFMPQADRVIALHVISLLSGDETSYTSQQYLWQADITLGESSGSFVSRQVTLYDDEVEEPFPGAHAPSSYALVSRPTVWVEALIQQPYSGLIHYLDIAWGESPAIGDPYEDAFTVAVADAGMDFVGIELSKNWLAGSEYTAYPTPGVPDSENPTSYLASQIGPRHAITYGASEGDIQRSLSSGEYFTFSPAAAHFLNPVSAELTTDAVDLFIDHGETSEHRLLFLSRTSGDDTGDEWDDFDEYQANGDVKVWDGTEWSQMVVYSGPESYHATLVWNGSHWIPSLPPGGPPP